MLRVHLSSTVLTSQIKGLEAAIRNAADAISLTQTAEGAIEEVTQILHRMRELSVQSANGVYTGQDRQAIQNEVRSLAGGAKPHS